MYYLISFTVLYFSKTVTQDSFSYSEHNGIIIISPVLSFQDIHGHHYTIEPLNRVTFSYDITRIKRQQFKAQVLYSKHWYFIRQKCRQIHISENCGFGGMGLWGRGEEGKGRELPQGLKQFWLQQRQIAYWIFDSKSTVSLLNRIALWWDTVSCLHSTLRNNLSSFSSWSLVLLSHWIKQTLSITRTQTEPNYACLNI